MITKQFTLYLENKQGELAGIIGKVSKGSVNIEGISLAASTDVGLVQLVTSDAAKTKKVLVKAGVAFTGQDVCVITMADEAGALFKVVSAMAKAKINLNYVYATGGACCDGGSCKVVISANNLKKVEAAWNKAVKKGK
jgi:hypothetical protein